MSSDYLNDLFGMQGRVALVTGGSRGIGRMIAEALVRAGARVLIASRDADSLNAAAEELSGLEGSCEAIPADLSNEDGVNRLGSEVNERCDALHVLVNNSGKTWGQPFADFPWQAWEGVMSINVAAPFTLTRNLTPLLSATGRADDPARVINIGSINGMVPHSQMAWSYGASKAALHHLTRTLSNELASQHITVNAIAPGPFPSKMMAYVTEHPGRRAAIEKAVPLGRLGAPRDIAAQLLALCGPAGGYVTGAIVPVDGGMSADCVEWMDPSLLLD